jgi:cytochrome c biogenesis protein CcmG, thiol:disulfide interchange protein DsbE
MNDRFVSKCPTCGSADLEVTSTGTLCCRNCGAQVDSSNVLPAVRKRLPVWVIAVAFTILFAFLALIAGGLKRAQSGPIALGDRVPAFTLTTFDGENYSIPALTGKVIVVNFWASWCKPCEQEAAEMETAWQFYKPGGQVIFWGIDYVDTEPEARKYLEKFNITYPNGPDLRTSISQLFRIRGVPETYIIGRDGTLKFIKIGPFTSVAEVTGVIDKLLK